MPITINTNVGSLNAQRHLAGNTVSLGKSLEKLASGYRINRSGDDAAGLQLSERLRSQIRGSKKALDNVQDAMNVLNIVDGAYNQITENLQRMRELAVQAANDTYNTAQRTAMQAEAEQLSDDITRIAQATQFNGKNLLTGSQTEFNVQLGPNAGATANSLDLTTLTNNPFATCLASAIATGIATGSFNFDTFTDATAAISAISAALDEINARRGDLGAVYNRLEGAANNLMNAIENFSASESRIRNVDVAAESANMIKNQILQQASSTVLAQANQAPSLALTLLQG